MKNLVIALLALMALTSQTNAQQCDERSNVMIVLDRSISMRRDLEGCDSVNPSNCQPGPSKWDIATGAIQSMLDREVPNSNLVTSELIDFGLMIYPYADDGGSDRGVTGSVDWCRADLESKLEADIDTSDPNQVPCGPLAPRCSTGEVVVSPGSNTRQNILDALVFPNGLTRSFTPTWQTLQYASTKPELLEADTRNYVILVTDGQQCCGVFDLDPNAPGYQATCENQDEERNRMLPAINALRDAGITTYVVGFGGYTAVDPDTLHESAIAAGTPREGCDPNQNVSESNTCYYQAGDAGDLNTFLNSIAVEIQMEVCDQVDNDCDGEIDEGFFGVGTEVCDGEDNNCNGQIDEGVRNACGTCGDLVEDCNGEDDDCDGRTDEGALNVCGVCGEVPQETCDGEDNDCDGETDEAYSRLGLACSVGVGECAREGAFVCTDSGLGEECDAEAGTGSAEVCDQKDNDCDGRVDEDTPDDCGTELCDREDNDGDGRIDEGGVEDGAPCESNLMGLCSQGFTRCVDGELTCEPRTDPISETCNEIDDDCDGRVDEFAADLNRCGDCGPAPLELCNGFDEDCDGRIDNNATCEVGQLCACGTCASPCTAGECIGGGRCIDGYCIIDACPQGYVCADDRTCTPGQRPEMSADAGVSGRIDMGTVAFDPAVQSPEVDDCNCKFNGGRPIGMWLACLMFLPFVRRRKS